MLQILPNQLWLLLLLGPPDVPQQTKLFYGPPLSTVLLGPAENELQVSTTFQDRAGHSKHHESWQMLLIDPAVTASLARGIQLRSPSPPPQEQLARSPTLESIEDPAFLRVLIAEGLHVLCKDGHVWAFTFELRIDSRCRLFLFIKPNCGSSRHRGQNVQGMRHQVASRVENLRKLLEPS